MAIRLDQQQSLQVDHLQTISRFLSWPKISSTKVRKGNHPYIDYIKSFIMTSTNTFQHLQKKANKNMKLMLNRKGEKQKRKQEINKSTTKGYTTC